MQGRLTGVEIGGFVIGPHLAEGGMGSVYQAFQPGSNGPLAIKVMLPEFSEDAELRERFEREASLMQSLNHPHIMPVFAAGEQNGMLYFVMPFVRGPSLYELLGRRRFSPMTAWQILNPVAQALGYAHSRGVVHRDIKPGNILIESRKPKGNHVYLVDFGLSKVVGAATLTRTGIALGTPHYMAPEQVLSKPFTPLSDLYTLGVLMYEVLLGQLPFNALKPQDIAFMHVHDLPPTPRSLRPDFPKPLEPILLQALAKDPKDRFASADEFRLAYAQAVQRISPEARKVEYWVNIPTEKK
ncbi:MAG: serine/threonine-protein kinase [Chloroflexota bacterium]